MESIAKKPMTAGEKKTVYTAFIKSLISSDGWQIADKTNKASLAAGLVDQPLYSEAARLIVAACLAD